MYLTNRRSNEIPRFDDINYANFTKRVMNEIEKDIFEASKKVDENLLNYSKLILRWSTKI
jgi:hypothetical protein